MENELIKIASNQGIWAALSVSLIYYVLKTQEKKDSFQSEKEQKYQEIINKLTDECNSIKDIQKDIFEMKSHISK